MKKIIIFIGLAISIAVFAAKPIKYPKKVSVKKLTQWIDTCQNLQIIDVRDKKSFELAHIKGALVASKSKRLFSIVDSLGTKKIYVLYCEEGDTSRQAGSMLLDKYNVKVYSLKGGFEQWMEKGMPVY